MTMSRTFSLVVLIFVLIACGCRQTAAGEADGTLYARLGGKAMIDRVVDDLVRRASVDPKVNFSRMGTDRPWHATDANLAQIRSNLSAYLSQACGGPISYKGASMKSAHAKMAISNTEFDAFAAHLIASLDRFGIQQQEKDELLAIVGATRQDIVERK